VWEISFTNVCDRDQVCGSDPGQAMPKGNPNRPCEASTKFVLSIGPASKPREAPQKMTPLQNDPQQQQRETKHRKCRVTRGGKRSPDSESARRELSKSGLAYFGSRKSDFASDSGRGTTAGAPTRTRVRPNQNQCATETLSRTPYRSRYWGNVLKKCFGSVSGRRCSLW
jgi:hypothetical protein